jgi:2-polyprenyl-3-methyl-5-hydroxy-6-metoxy-1,4-benzoquinol methylase
MSVSSPTNRLTTIVCPACHACDWQPIPATHGGDYARCRVCRYHLRLASDNERHEVFEQEQQKFYGDDSFCMTQLFRELQAARVENRIRVVQRYLAQGRLIEVGPGSGEVLGRFARLGYEVTGVEHSATMAETIRRQYAVDVRVGAFEDHQFPPSSYDAYLSFHVIEHVTDVVAHLQQAAAIVRSGGFAFIATPNADSWEHRLAQALSPNYSPVHLQLFSRDSMRRLLERTGWALTEVLTPCYTDAWLRVASSVYRRLRGKRGGSGELVNRSDTPARRSLIRALGVLDLPLRTVQQWLRGGNELFVVATRRESPQSETAGDR